MASAREMIIAGNWKMYKTIPEAVDFVKRLAPAVKDLSVKVFLAVPYTAISVVAEEAKDTSIVIGAQNMNDASEGAFTGEIAASMLIDAGAKFSLLGHSERRHIFGETNEFIHRKVVKALQSGLRPILCVGETADEKESGNARDVIKEQLTVCLQGLSPEDAQDLVVAYEPVWAIGTGKTATPEIAQNEHKYIRSVLEKLFGKAISDKITIQYGGSVKPSNAKELMGEPDIDGLLVGGASLSTKSFAEILESVTTSKIEI